MKNPTVRLLGLAAAAAVAVLLAACSATKTPVPGSGDLPQNPRQVDKKTAHYANPYPKGTYEHFVASREYPYTMKEYADASLLKQAGAKKTFVVICLPEQRGRLYVGGRVALDWPVSTGVSSHPTPPGSFKVMSKELDHHSSRYGTFRNDSGRVVNGNADILKEAVPEGCTFKPSPMPYWQRLTGDGVGIHIGKVRPGRRLSHGCIRSPRSSAVKLYAATRVGTPVYITRSVEDFKTGAVDPADLKRVYKSAPVPAKRKPAVQSAAPKSGDVTPATPPPAEQPSPAPGAATAVPSSTGPETEAKPEPLPTPAEAQPLPTAEPASVQQPSITPPGPPSAA